MTRYEKFYADCKKYRKKLFKACGTIEGAMELVIRSKFAVHPVDPEGL